MPRDQVHAVGFDLDMTLIDSRPGYQAALDLLAAETGVPIDSVLAASRLGRPVESELACWFPEERVAMVTRQFRALFLAHGVAAASLMPGATAAVAAARDRCSRVVVVTSKSQAAAMAQLLALGLRVDAVFGDAFAAGKGTVIRAERIGIFVGDHLGDMEGARVGCAVAVAVATGPCGESELRSAGADVVLPDLVSFPRWLDVFLAA